MIESAVTLKAIFNKAQTLVDGGWRISFDVDASQTNEVMMLARLREAVIQAAFVPIPADAELVEDQTDLEAYLSG